MHQTKNTLGTVRRKLGVAMHLAALGAMSDAAIGNTLGVGLGGSGRSHFGALYQRGGSLAHTLAFEDDGDTAVDELPEAEFQEKVIKDVGEIGKEVKEQKTKQQTLLSNYDQLSKDYKKLTEEFTKMKKTANDQQANADSFVKQIKKLEDQLRNESRMAFGDPIARIQRDTQLKTLFNALVRQSVLGPNEKLPAKFAAAIKEAQEERDSVSGKALGEDTSPGSTLIDDRLASEIYDTLDMFGIWNTFAVTPTGTMTTKFPVKTARTTANFILTEGGTVSDGSMTGTSVSNVMEVIAVLINVANQLIEDSEFDLTSYVLEDFSEAYGERLDHACLNADGTADATNGGMTGIFQGGTAATADAGAGADDTVEELEFEDWTRCLLTVDPIVLQRAARWWMHPRIIVRALSIKDSNGRPIFLTALEAPTPGAIGSILGYPVTPAFKAPSTNSANQKVAVFGDPRGLSVGIRRAFTFEASDHHRWNTLERSFRGWGRAGTKIRRALAFAMLTLGA
jgi:HK97 family phage major capsid protein